MKSQQTVKKIVITGGAGYIANSLVSSLPADLEIVTIDNFHIDTEHKRVANQQLAASRNVTLINANVSEVEKYQDHLKNADVVIYMASLNSYKESNSDPLLYLTENNLNMQMFLSAVKKNAPNVQKMLLTSTRGIYGEGPYLCKACQNRVSPALAEQLICPACQNTDLVAQKINETDVPNPTSYYGVTKKIQEDLIKMYCLQANIPLDIFRIFNVYGENQGDYYSNIGVIPQMFEQIKTKKEIYLSGNGAVARDFVYIGDIVKVLTQSIFSENVRKNQTEVYHLGSGNAVTISDIAQYFEDLGYTFEKKYHPEFNDIKYSIADNAKVLATFNLEKFSNLFDFLNTFYTSIQESR